MSLQTGSGFLPYFNVGRPAAEKPKPLYVLDDD